MEEKSPYARPLKQMNAVRQGQSWQMYEEDTNTDLGKPPGERVKDENLTVKQLMYRYSGIACQAVMKMPCYYVFHLEEQNFNNVSHLEDQKSKFMQTACIYQWGAIPSL